jgi:hypothetical protein
MKTSTFPRASLIAGFFRAALTAAVVTATLAVGSLFAAPAVKTLGGGTSGPYYGYLNTNTLQALFHTPMGLAVNQSGEVFVADRDNNAVRELVDVTGTENGNTFPFTTNHISSPVGVVLDAAGNVYVLNRGGTSAVNTNGTVLEFNSYAMLIATNASNLTNASAIAIDPFGNLYVTERTNLVVEISGGVQTTIATVPYTNANLQGIAYLTGGSLAVCDSSRDGVYTITPNGTPSGIIATNAGFNGPGDTTGIDNQGYPVAYAQFFAPSGVAAAGDGTLIISDYGNDRVKVITTSGIVTNLYGVSSNDWDTSYYPGWVDGTVSVPDEPDGVAGRCPLGVALSPDGTTVYTTEDYYHIVRSVTGTSFAPPPTPPPGAPTGLTGIIVTNSGAVTGISLAWNADSSGSDVTNYIVEESSYSGGPYSIVGNTSGTTFTYAPVTAGATYYFVVQAENSGGESLASAQIGFTIPIQPPAPPTIGWVQYQQDGDGIFNYVLVPFSPGTNNIFNNLISMAILPNITNGTTYYVSGPSPLTNNPTSGGTAPTFVNDQLTAPKPLTVTIVPNLAINAANVNAAGMESEIESDQILFQAGNPVISGTNAAQFTLYDATTNTTFYYTTDGSNPLTNQAALFVVSTNDQPITVTINDSSTFTLSVVAEYPGFAPSAVVTSTFLAQNFQGNELTWGFQSGYCSSEFIGSPGEIFYAPVTLTTLPGAAMYGLEFDMVVTNLGPDPVPSGDFSFKSMLQYTGTASNTLGTVYYPIPPYMFIGDASSPPPPDQIVSFNGTNFVDLETWDTNLNELAVGWYEIYGKTNLFNTLSQNLLSYSLAFIQLLPGGSFPNDVIVGGYAFQIPTNAQAGEQYQIQLNRASGNSDGYGGANSAVVVSLPENGSLTNGAINATKLVTVGQPHYMAGDVYPFRWFNAGDFGNGDLTNYAANDVEAIFNAAVYDLNNPSANEPGSDFADAMDTAGGIGVYDAAAGYWTNAGPATATQNNAIFNANDNTTINEMAFGDGILDICDVYVTFIRSQFPNTYWFERFYTNDTVHGVFGRVAQAIYPQTNIDNSAGLEESLSEGGATNFAVSITNTPLVHFSAGDYLASAGQTVSIPITATVYGQNPLRMVMFNADVIPLDGSPAVTSAINFSLASPFNNSSIYNQPNPLNGTESYSTTNFAAAVIPTSFPISANASVTGSNVIGYLSFTVPASATSQSSYAVYFGHASASPNGLVSFPRSTFTGLVTLSSRTNSYYNDGIPDSWRLRYFGTIYNQLSVSNADADGTTLDNWQKYLAGLNPVDPTSVLNEGLDQAVAQSPQDAVVYWPSVNGQTYIIWRSTSLFPPQWTAISTNIGDGTYMEIHDPSGSGQRYYNVTTQ